MRTRWDRRRALAVATGGVAGAATRWAIVTTVPVSGLLPWPVLVVNVAGSFLLGIVLAHERTHARARVLLHDGAAIGFCGGLTTFSTFALEVVQLTRDGEESVAVLYAMLSLVLSLGGVVGGAAALRRVRAVALPVEEWP